MFKIGAWPGFSFSSCMLINLVSYLHALSMSAVSSRSLSRTRLSYLTNSPSRTPPNARKRSRLSSHLAAISTRGLLEYVVNISHCIIAEVPPERPSSTCNAVHAPRHPVDNQGFFFHGVTWHYCRTLCRPFHIQYQRFT